MQQLIRTDDKLMEMSTDCSNMFSPEYTYK